MLQIQFEPIPIKSITKLGKIKTGKCSSDGSLSKLLGKLFPEQQSYFEQQNEDKLSISMRPSGPVWPDADILIDFLFDDFPKALQDIKRKFSLDEIEIQGCEHVNAMSAEDGITLTEDDSDPNVSISLDIFEFFLLHEAAIKGEENPATIIIISSGPEQHFAFFADKNTSVKEIADNAPLLKQALKENPETKIYNPLKKVISEVDDPISIQGITYLTLSDSALSVAAERSFLFPFPQFNRKFQLQNNARNSCPTACINCLACVEHCPAGIFPNYLYHNLASDNPAEAFDLNLKACRQCGKCSLVCPSKLPLYKTIRDGLNCEETE